MPEQLTPPAEVTFRAATPQDAEAVAKTFLASSRSSYTDTAQNKSLGMGWVEEALITMQKKYGDPYWADLIQKSLMPNNQQLFIVSEDAERSINGLMYLVRGSESVWLDAIYLSPEVQGQGIGSQLLARAEEFAQGLPLELEVMEKNQKAIDFYAKNGFKQSSEVFKRKPDTPAVFLMKKETNEV